jgi:hypothetical protein
VLHGGVAEFVVVEYISKDIHAEINLLRLLDVFFPFPFDLRGVEPVKIQIKVADRDLG